MNLQIQVLWIQVMPSLHWYSADMQADSRLLITVQFCGRDIKEF